jgi:prevent-host-death family protein
MDVGVRELKARLSAYLRRAAAGERLTITDRGRPVAVLGPLLSGADLSIGVEEGWITPATESGLRPTIRHSAERSVLAVLDEDRVE